MMLKLLHILMTGCKDMGKKLQKYPQKWGLSPICDPQDFFSKIRLSLFYPYGALTSCRKLEKTNGQSPRYLKMDGRTDRITTDGRTRVITKDPSRKPAVQNFFWKSYLEISL